MGEFFTSFEDAWAYFLARDEPLESFFDQFAAEPDLVAEGWLIVPPAEVKRAALRVQVALEDVRGLRIVPHHFLHVWLRDGQGADIEKLLEGPPFEVALPRLNCFHTAIVAEAVSPRLREVDAPEQFLPHQTLAVVELPIEPDAVRDVLVRLRETSLGSFVVEELVRVRFPAGRTTVLEPWTIVERVRLPR